MKRIELTVVVNVHDAQALNECAKAAYSLWGDDSWEPKDEGEALYEAIIGSNSSVVPHLMGVEIVSYRAELQQSPIGKQHAHGLSDTFANSDDDAGRTDTYCFRETKKHSSPARFKNLDWFIENRSQLLKSHGDCWVAVGEDALIASGPTPQAVLKLAKAKRPDLKNMLVQPLLDLEERHRILNTGIACTPMELKAIFDQRRLSGPETHVFMVAEGDVILNPEAPLAVRGADLADDGSYVEIKFHDGSSMKSFLEHPETGLSFRVI